MNTFSFVLFLVFSTLVAVGLDKLTTYLNISTVQKRYPKIDATQVEKNPMARYFFRMYGLVNGSIIYAVISMFSFIIAFGLLAWTISFFSASYLWNSLIALDVIYLMVILWNLNMFFRFKNGDLDLVGREKPKNKKKNGA